MLYIAYANAMIRSTRGFTLIELVLAVIIIGIIASIVIVGWGSVGGQTRDRAREADVRTWAAAFDLYKSRFIAYPALPTADTPGGDVTLCLGPFTSTSSKCGQYGSSTATQFIAASGSTSLITNIGKTASNGAAPTDTGPAINNALVGPLVYLSQTTSGTTITVTAKFINFFETNCPSTDFTDISASLPASIAQVLTGLPGGTSAKACALTKTLTYTTN